MGRKTNPKKAKSKAGSSGARTPKPGPEAESLRQAKSQPQAKSKPVSKPVTESGPKPKAWTADDIEQAFRRFRAANPQPRGELEHVDPYTLLVAVVLSAQATDAGVNKATPALFAAADTPEKMVALGEAKLRDLIKSIGLYRTKA
jgi:endonuclease-3